MEGLVEYWRSVCPKKIEDFEEGKCSRHFDRVEEIYNINVALGNLNFSFPGRENKREHRSISLTF